MAGGAFNQQALKGEMDAQLDIAWRAVRARDGTKRRVLVRAAGGIGVAQIGMVECVESVYLYADIHLIPNPLRLGQGDIRIHVAGAKYFSQARIAKLILRRCSKATGVEPFRGPSDFLDVRTRYVGPIAHTVIEVVGRDMDGQRLS